MFYNKINFKKVVIFIGGTISDDNCKLIVIINKELKDKFSVLAKKDNRSMSNLAAKLISDYVKSQE